MLIFFTNLSGCSFSAMDIHCYLIMSQFQLFMLTNVTDSM